MAWDSNRPVPWRRLLTLFAVYAGVASVVLIVISRNYTIGTFLGLLAGLVIYLALAWVLVKFGWNPPALRPRDAAREAAERRAAKAAAAPTPVAPDPARPRPAPTPTKRTNAGNRRAGSSTRRR